jgi:hypothetical protein
MQPGPGHEMEVLEDIHDMTCFEEIIRPGPRKAFSQAALASSIWQFRTRDLQSAPWFTCIDASSVNSQEAYESPSLPTRRSPETTPEPIAHAGCLGSMQTQQEGDVF